MASLFEAIVLQHLSVLTRHTLRPHVLLLGGPNGFIRGMREAWQTNIPRMWKERKVEIPDGTTAEELIKVPENAQYFAALGSVGFGKEEEPAIGRYQVRTSLSTTSTLAGQKRRQPLAATVSSRKMPNSLPLSPPTRRRSSTPQSFTRAGRLWFHRN
jgi:activator of 2-hydroxyglutaryl-CoA dehydratase